MDNQRVIKSQFRGGVRNPADGARDVVFLVPEDKLLTIRPGVLVKVRGWVQDAQQIPNVHEVSASADPVTRPYQVKVALNARNPAPPLGATVAVLPQGLGTAHGL